MKGLAPFTLQLVGLERTYIQWPTNTGTGKRCRQSAHEQAAQQINTPEKNQAQCHDLPGIELREPGTSVHEGSKSGGAAPETTMRPTA
jgi:hypothetical protein